MCKRICYSHFIWALHSFSSWIKYLSYSTWAWGIDDSLMSDSPRFESEGDATYFNRFDKHLIEDIAALYAYIGSFRSFWGVFTLKGSIVFYKSPPPTTMGSSFEFFLSSLFPEVFIFCCNSDCYWLWYLRLLLHLRLLYCCKVEDLYPPT